MDGTMDNDKPLQCIWCKHDPVVRITGEVECEECGYACDSVKWWNAAMTDPEVKLHVLPCKNCGMYPYRYSDDLYGCNYCSDSKVKNRHMWNAINAYAEPKDIGELPCKKCGISPAFYYALFVTDLPSIRCNNTLCSAHKDEWLLLPEWNRRNAKQFAEPEKAKTADNVVHPSHYNWFGVECMDVVKHFDFVNGNVIKYVWRAGWKPSATKLEDLKKARYYIEIAIAEEESRLNGK